MKNILKNKQKIQRDLVLFLQNPKEYLYTFTYPKNQEVSFETYNPKIKKIGEKIVATISSTFPELPVYFIGSSVLGIIGQKDIDIYVACDFKDLKKYLPRFVSLFGEPAKVKRKFLEWHFPYQGYRVEIFLGDSHLPQFRIPLQSYSVLKHNKKVLREYQSLKKGMNGAPIREYQKVRLEFFHRILKQYSM